MLYEKILEDYKISMKEKQEIRKIALNFVLAQLKNKKIELKRDLSDDEVIAILKKEIKSLNESIGFLEKANKPEELAEEQEKKNIIEGYLPQMLDHEATETLIKQIIEKLGITDLKKERGALMKELMASHRSELDGSLVNEIINNMI